MVEGGFKIHFLITSNHVALIGSSWFDMYLNPRRINVTFLKLHQNLIQTSNILLSFIQLFARIFSKKFQLLMIVHIVHKHVFCDIVVIINSLIYYPHYLCISIAMARTKMFDRKNMVFLSSHQSKPMFKLSFFFALLFATRRSSTQLAGST